ncbi:MAG: hypothetical protein ACK5ZT_02860, partial [Sphingobacteriaceae bacterium]
MRIYKLIVQLFCKRSVFILLILFSSITSGAQNMDSLQKAADLKKDPLDKALLYVQLSNFCEIKEIESYALKAIDLAQPFA